MLKANFSYQIFLSDDGTYSVNTFIVKECGKDDYCDVGDTITVVGNNIPTYKSITYILEGVWKSNKKMNGQMQFQFMGYQEDTPKTKNDILNYLGSGIIKGIGKKNAVVIYEAFGNDALQIIENEPERLLELKGFGKKSVKMITDSYSLHKKSKDTLLFLSKLEIDLKLGKKIYDKFKEETKKIVEENPYKLCEIKGINFERADIIYAKLGGKKTDKIRVEAAILWALKMLEQEEGNTGTPIIDLENRLYKVLQLPKNLEYTPLINCYSKEMIKEKKVIIDSGLCYRPHIYDMETECASHFIRIKNGKSFSTKKDLDKVIKSACFKKNIMLDEKQMESVRGAVLENMFVITGGPGSGKTTTINIIIEVLKELFPKKSIKLMAPTGRAARRMTESTGVQAYTIHSTLRLSREKTDVTPEMLEDDIFIVDEVSMMDMRIATLLLRAIDDDKKVIFIGDIDQLPSVDPGFVLRDIIESNVIKVVKLERIFRQSSDSAIYINSQKIKNGETDLKEAADFHIIDVDNFEAAAHIMTEVYKEKIGKYGINDVACLTPYRKYVAGSEYMNGIIQSYVNPDVGQNEITFMKKVFRETDLVMNLVNADKDGVSVSNGDIGTIVNIDKTNDKILVEYFDDAIVTYSNEEFEELELGYSYTIHKSQGSEYPCVITCLCDQHIDKMKTRNILYTALTRAKKEFIIIGSREAIKYAIGHVIINGRRTLLSEKMKRLNRRYNVLA